MGEAATKLLVRLEKADNIDPTEKRLKEEFYTFYKNLNGWVAAAVSEKKALDQHRRLTDDEKKINVELYSMFNDALRNIFNRWGNKITDADILTHINALTGINSNEYFLERMKRTITGVRTEMSFESVMAILGIETKRATTEEDSRGIDYTIYIDGRGFKIDIKTSQRGVDEANIRNRNHGNRDGVIAFCPFPPSTLRGISTILPKDPYAQMLIPAYETADKLFKEGFITTEQHTAIKEDLVRQIKETKGRTVYA